MGLELIDCVREIVRLAEEKISGRITPVEVTDIPVQARLELSDESPPGHRLVYRADHDEGINYSVASQCVHAIRLFGADEDSRFLPVAERRSMMKYLLQIEGELKRLSSFYGSEQLKHFVLMWYQGVVFQLTKMPTDIVVDRWLYDNCPELRPVQKSSVESQRAAALRTIDLQWREITPSIIYYTSNVMNYVYFKMLEDIFQADYVAPYHSTIFLMDGNELLRKTVNSGVTDDHDGDRKRIDIWADFLGLTGWFEWVPFRENPGPSNMFSG